MESINQQKQSSASPGQFKMLQVVNKMGNSKDRLEKISLLETQNMAQSSLEISTRNATEIKTLYEQETEHSRALIGDLIQELFDSDIEMNKQKGEMLETLKKLATHNREVYARLFSIKAELTRRTNELEQSCNQNKNHVIKIASLESHVKELEDKLSKQFTKYETDMNEKDKKIDSTRKELSKLELEYEELSNAIATVATSSSKKRKITSITQVQAGSEQIVIDQAMCNPQSKCRPTTLGQKAHSIKIEN